MDFDGILGDFLEFFWRLQLIISLSNVFDRF